MQRLLSLLSAVILMRALGDEGYGIFAYILVIISFSVMCIDLGMENILVREYAKDSQRGKDLLQHALLIKSVITVFFIILMMVFKDWLSSGQDSSNFFLIMGWLIIVSLRLPTVKNVFQIPFRAKLQMKIPVMIETGTEAVIMICLFAGYLLQMSAAVLVGIYVFGNLPGFVTLLVVYCRRYSVRLKWKMSSVEYLVKESFPLAAFWLLATISQRIDVIMIEYYRGMEEVGWYAAAFRLTEPLSFMPVALTVSLLPVLSRMHGTMHSDYAQAVAGSMKITWMLGWVAAFSIFPVAPLLIEWIAGSEFLPAATALQILIWAQIAVFMNILFHHLLIARNQQWRSLMIVTVMVLINVTANLIFIPLYGYIGASLTTVATEWIALSCLIGMVWIIWKDSSLLRLLGMIVVFSMLFGIYMYFYALWIPSAVLFGFTGLIGIAYFLLFPTRQSRMIIWNAFRTCYKTPTVS